MKLEYGDRLRLAREHHNLTQGKLAEISGVGQGTISKIERGDQHSSGYDAELAYILGIEAMWLKTGNDKFAPSWILNNQLNSSTPIQSIKDKQTNNKTISTRDLFNQDNMRIAIEWLEEYCQEEDIDLSPKDYANIALSAYELLQDVDEEDGEEQQMEYARKAIKSIVKSMTRH